MNLRLLSIKQRIEALGIYLNRVTSEETVAAFEKKYRIQLPTEYRRFILEVGNGGQGPPHFGHFTLEESDQYASGRIYQGFDPAESFLLTTPWLWGDSGYDENLADRVITKGHIFLGHSGCGIMFALITTGPERGNVWTIEGIGAYRPGARTKPVTYLKWIEEWLATREKPSTRVSDSLSGSVRQFSFWIANRTVGMPMLEGLDYSVIFSEPSALEQTYAIFMNSLELDEAGKVINAKHAERRAAQYIHQYITGLAATPSFEDWELRLK